MGSPTSSQRIRGYISVMAVLKFIYFLNESKNALLKTIAELVLFAICLFRLTVRISD